MKEQMPRIIAGSLKGRHLSVAEGTRPITDRVKRSLFDTLGDFIKDKKVLDVFAGSGSIGFEALSRGAAFVHFNDKSKTALELIKSSAIKLGVEQLRYSLSSLDYNKLLSRVNKDFDIIFLDPPFKLFHTLSLKKLQPIMRETCLGIIKWRVGSDDVVNTVLEPFIIIDQKVSGINVLTFFRKRE